MNITKTSLNVGPGCNPGVVVIAELEVRPGPGRQAVQVALQGLSQLQQEKDFFTNTYKG
jgi:UDP-N-acetyl-D-mannosaminuronate dehydrogenase